MATENLGFRENFTVDPNNPEPIGQCDRCGGHFNLSALKPQMEWAGDSLMPTGGRHCPGCLDEPNEQLRTIILKPDPEPAEEPRPDDSGFIDA
jgi:hypothetical protein